jgi:quercetin dioxygenase-like cupin family protein
MATPGMAHNDPVSVDSKHYKVEFENERVRVLRIKYGPHEKSSMHSHPASVLFCVTDFHGRFTFPDGRTEERRAKAGETVYFQAEEHLPENLSDKPLEVVQVELKR